MEAVLTGNDHFAMPGTTARPVNLVWSGPGVDSKAPIGAACV